MGPSEYEVKLRYIEFMELYGKTGSALGVRHQMHDWSLDYIMDFTWGTPLTEFSQQHINLTRGAIKSLNKVRVPLWQLLREMKDHGGWEPGGFPPITDPGEPYPIDPNPPIKEIDPPVWPDIPSEGRISEYFIKFVRSQFLKAWRVAENAMGGNKLFWWWAFNEEVRARRLLHLAGPMTEDRFDITIFRKALKGLLAHWENFDQILALIEERGYVVGGYPDE